MERRSAPLNFTLRIKARLLHKLVQLIASRAYRIGFEDGQEGRESDPGKVEVDPSQIRKFL